MEKSAFAKNLDQIQAEVNRFLKPLRFRKNSRSFNRPADDGLIHVINFQMGRFEIGPPSPIPELRENFYGKFWTNLGVFLPCVYSVERSQPIPTFLQEYDCQIRTRLGTLAFGHDQTFEISDDVSTLAGTIVTLLDQFGLPFLEQFRNYTDVLNYFESHGAYPQMNSGRATFEAAIISHALGRPDQAQHYFEQALDPNHKPFSEHVREIALKLGYTI